MPDLTLRDLRPEDLPAVFAFQRSPEANRMAAFVVPDPDDRRAFTERWERLLGDGSVLSRAVLEGGRLVGTVMVYGGPGEREVTYWISPADWGRGLATGALSALLDELPERPLHARVAKDNLGSLRVLEKCGFTVRGEDSGWAEGRGAETEEWLLTLDDHSPS